MTVTVVDVVDVLRVRHGDVPAARTMGVVVGLVLRVPRWLALVDVAVVLTVEVTVVHVIHVIGVRHGDVPACGAVAVIVRIVLGMGCGTHVVSSLGWS